MQYIGGSLSFNSGLSINFNKIVCVRKGVHLYSTKKDTKLKRFTKGLIIGFNMSLLPPKVLCFHNNILVRILRVIGGISVITLLGKWYGDYYIIVFPIAIFHFIYIIFINFCKVVYIVYLWRNGKLDVRNSPLDRLASFGVRLVACTKGVCDFGIGVGGAIGLGLGIDEILTYFGREPAFKNTVGGYFDELLTKHGYEKPQNNINNHEKSINLLKKKINKYDSLLKDLDDLNGINISEEDKELFNKRKRWLRRLQS